MKIYCAFRGKPTLADFEGEDIWVFVLLYGSPAYVKILSHCKLAFIYANVSNIEMDRAEQYVNSRIEHAVIYYIDGVRLIYPVEVFSTEEIIQKVSGCLG